MKQEHKETFLTLFQDWFRDDSAVEFAYNTVLSSHLWDDLVDMDYVQTPDEASYVMEWLTIGVHYNKFFNENKYYLLPIMKMIISSWQVSNTFEQKGIELEKAYMLRAMLYSLFGEIARCLGKDANYVHQQAWEHYGETIETHREEFEKCQIQ